MIIRCSGLSPDGVVGCTRPLGHDERDQPCKNHSTGITWCSLCDSYGCEHVDVVEATIARAEYELQRESRRERRARR